MNQVGVKWHKHSSENQLNPVIKKTQQRLWKREKFVHSTFRGSEATWTDHIKTHSWIRHKAGHSWGREDWWGWVSKRRPFKVILCCTHSMGPKISRFKGIFLQRKNAWETQWMVYSVIGKGFWNAPHFSSPGARVSHSSRFTNNLPTGRISTFHLLFRTVSNLSGRWTGRGGTSERLALGVGTGTGHSIFPSGRRINHRLSLPPEQD